MSEVTSSNSRDTARVHGSEAVEVFAGDLTAPVIGVIRDISETGAHIRIVGAQDLPDEIRLTSPSIGAHRKATIRWRDETNIGIHFNEPLLD